MCFLPKTRERKKERRKDVPMAARRPVWLPRLNDHNFPNYFRSNTSHTSVLGLATLTRCDSSSNEEQDNQMLSHDCSFILNLDSRYLPSCYYRHDGEVAKLGLPFPRLFTIMADVRHNPTGTRSLLLARLAG